MEEDGVATQADDGEKVAEVAEAKDGVATLAANAEEVIAVQHKRMLRDSELNLQSTFSLH